MECKICGRETRKERPICIGCYSLKEVVIKKGKSPKTKIERAAKHLLKNPNLSIISWASFAKK